MDLTPLEKDKIRPDVAVETKLDYLPLDWVGMSEIQLPVIVETQSGPMSLMAQISASVSLDKKANRGIHMSRLYAILQDVLVSKTLTISLIQNILDQFLASHIELSSRAKLLISLGFPVKRKALMSDLFAWRNYPIEYIFEKSRTEFIAKMKLQVLYSSTCPASAGLSRQVLSEEFRKTFVFNSEGVPDFAKTLNAHDVAVWLNSPAGQPATPHAQRSEAIVELQLNSKIQNESSLDPISWIDSIEEALKTPVQTVVKRIDEQEFARRNGQNLMFCEDAARRIQNILKGSDDINGFSIRVSHQESLHPHNAVAEVSETI